MSPEKKERSVAQTNGGFTVAPSPFNPVKLDLGIILLIGVVVFLLHGRITDNTLMQFVILLGYGLLSAVWLVVRVRKISRNLEQVKDGQEKTQ